MLKKTALLAFGGFPMMIFFFINCFKSINDDEDNAENYDNELEDGDGLLI